MPKLCAKTRFLYFRYEGISLTQTLEIDLVAERHKIHYGNRRCLDGLWYKNGISRNFVSSIKANPRSWKPIPKPDFL